ncbi:MAG: hypothetical protein IH886_05305 [Nitrospinae bacterium]|nr:hypothetical protein [Nitrospinota bacterium]
MTVPIPRHTSKKYSPAGKCIYCLSKENLSDEHIIPYAAGGRWVLPDASCNNCSTLTGQFEQVCMRKLLGPMRMHFDFPSRQKSKRPKALPLKVKFNPDEDWIKFHVKQEEYPFLILFPFFTMPDALSGYTTSGRRDASAKKFWIRGSGFEKGINEQMQKLAEKYGFCEIFPTGEMFVSEFCLMLAKIAHSYAVAELGVQGFEPVLTKIIRDNDMSDRATYIGGLNYEEPHSPLLHELSFETHTCNKPNLVGVRIRLFAHFDTPTYYVVAGRRL